MNKRQFLAALLLVLPLPLAAQALSMITMDEEPHHHLALKNDVVKVFEIDLASHDVFLMHGHDHDDVLIVVGDATTVSTTPGQADILQISKNGEVRFSRSGRSHSVRNIGQTPYRAVSIDLLRPQTGAHNLCGKQIPEMKPDCPVTAIADANTPRADLPQFETDQVFVTLTRIRPHQQASFGEADTDDLIVTIDEAVIAAAAGKGPDQALAPGGPVWVARGSAKRILKNNSDKELRIVTVAFKP